MYNINKIFYLTDPEFDTIINYCNNNNLDVIEISSDENGRRFQIQAAPDYTLRDAYRREYCDLLNWFEQVYKYKEQKYRRLIALNKLDDDGVDASEKLALLYTEAEEKRIRIQELEKLVEV